MIDGLPGKKELDLTGAAFERLLAWLDSDRERAGQKYEEIRARLMRFFEWQGCLYPGEYADRTINRVAKKLDEGVEVLASNRYLYFAGVARNILKEYWRHPDRAAAGSERIEQVRYHYEEGAEVKKLDLDRRLHCLEDCLQSLRPENREIITEYYKEEERVKTKTRKKLAERLGVPINALRIRCCRIRNALEQCIEDCLNRPSGG